MNHWKQKFRLRLPAIILLAATVFFWALYDRYEPAGPVLLQAPALADADYARGDCTETNGLFTLKVPAQKTARINFTVPGATEYTHLQARGRIKTDAVVRGKYAWGCARLLLLQFDRNNKWIPATHSVAAREKTADWKTHEEIFELRPETVRVDLSLQQIGKSGTVWFDGIKVQPVRLRASFIWWRIVFAALWIGLGILYFPRCRLHKRRLKLLILLNVLAILAGALMPGKWIEGSSQHLKQSLTKAFAKPPQSAPPKAPTAKPAPKPETETKRIDRFNELVGGTHRIGHFGLFASLCFLVYCSAALERQPCGYYLKVALDLLLFAAISEALQFLTFDRSAGLSDLLTDIYGMAAAFALFLLCSKIRSIAARHV